MATKYKADNYKGSGMSKGAYEKKQGKSSSSSSSSSAEKNAKKAVSKYYDYKSYTSKKTAEISSERLQEDLNRIYQEAGISQTRAIEDYNRNIKNIQENKASEISTLNDYVATSEERNKENLDTSLAKETRRYSIEYDQINQDLSDRGLTFSERTPEQIAKENSQLAKKEVATNIRRSFQDIARYEATKTKELELSYGQKTEAVETAKQRTLADIAYEQEKSIQRNARASQDITTGLETTLKDISYQKDTDIATLAQQFEQNSLSNKLSQEKQNAIG